MNPEIESPPDWPDVALQPLDSSPPVPGDAADPVGAQSDLAGELDRLDKAAKDEESSRVSGPPGLAFYERDAWLRNHTDEIKAALAAHATYQEAVRRQNEVNLRLRATVQQFRDLREKWSGYTEATGGPLLPRLWGEIDAALAGDDGGAAFANVEEMAGKIATLRYLLREAEADRDSARAERDHLRAEMKALIQEKRIAMARDVHPALAHGDLTVGTDQLERILGHRVLLSGEERALPESGDPS